MSTDGSKKKRRGRPPKDSGDAKDDLLQVRIDQQERKAFTDAARLSGLVMSAWVRERLRRIARQELEGAGLPVAFLRPEKTK
jgi:antitoxin component of RelBE/YafQ-DinJ toxin-antitoxin module